MNGFAKAIVATAMAGSSVAVQAAPSPVALAGDVKLEKTVTENGTTRIELREPKVVVPGDRLLFSTRYTNGGKVPVTNFIVTNPLPKAVVLNHEPAQGYVVSVDGGKTWGPLATARVSDGRGGWRAATATDVTHLRWTIATIAPGATGMVQYRATVR